MERIRSRETDVARLTSELSSVRAEASRLATTNAEAATQLQAERSAHERLSNEFKALSAEALRTNRDDFLHQAREAFSVLQQQSAGDLEQRKQAVESLVKPIRESLEKVDAKMTEIENARAGAYGALGEQLKALNVAQLQLHSEAARLSTALRSTTYAGSWGELQLRRVVEMADMLGYCDFLEQQSSGGLRADLVVRLPGGQRIVVDAKAPLESFRAAGDTTDEVLRTSRLLEHAQKVRGHIDALGAKNYWEQFQPAPEFVVLFLPGDHFLTAALQSDNLLLDRALSRRVLLATPTNLVVVARTAAHYWEQAGRNEAAEEIARLAKELHSRLGTMAEHMARMGRNLATANTAYNQMVGSFESQVLSQARKFEGLGAGSAKAMDPPPMVEASPRPLTKITAPASANEDDAAA